MGMFGDLGGSIGDLMNGMDRRKGATKGKHDAATSRRDYFADKREYADRLKKLDFTPAYESDAIGPYKRTQSPAARAYLESILTGDNPQAAASPWSTPGQQQTAQKSFGQRYGSVEGQLASGKSDRASTPWETRSPGAVDASAVKAYNPEYTDEDYSYGTYTGKGTR